MAKLFSFEDQGVDQSVTDEELDSSVEEGAAADVGQQMLDDQQEIIAMDTSVQTGTDAAAQLEEVQGGIQAAVDSEEGLDQPAAEGYRLAVESIAASVGYPAKSVYALYSTENFASTSSRLSNTRISLEGVGEFLKNLWERIKAAVKAVIEKVKAFYAKHLSGLGRVTKALDAMKAKITATKGSISTPRVKAPGSLRSAFPTSTTLKESDIQGYIETHKKATLMFKDKTFHSVVKVIDMTSKGSEGLGKIFEDAAKAAGGAADQIPDAIKEKIKNFSLETTEEISKEIEKEFGDKEMAVKTDPFVGGHCAKFEFTAPDQLSITREQVEMEKNADGMASVASKQEMLKLISECSKLIVDTKTFDKVVKDFSDSFGKLSTAAEKGFLVLETSADAFMKANKDGDHSDTKESLAKVRGWMRIIGKTSSMVPTFATGITYMNVKLGFSVVSYCKFNLAQYK